MRLKGIMDSSWAFTCLLTLEVIERLPVTQPAFANLVFRLPLIIGWRDQGDGTLDLHQHNVPDGAGGPTVPIEGERLLKERSVFVDGSRAFETIPLAGNRVIHVHLYHRLQLQI